MIYGIGTDLASISRMGRSYERHGERLLERILTPVELAQCRAMGAPAAFLARRFAAKEACAKALGTGLRHPVTLRNLTVTHDQLGRPSFAYGPELADYLAARRLRVHLSISDHGDYALAFALAERLEP